MARTTWKEAHPRGVSMLYRLQTCLDASRDTEIWSKYITVIEVGAGVIETNLPWKLLRQLFSLADVPMPSHWLTSDHPSWSECDECPDSEKPSKPGVYYF